MARYSEKNANSSFLLLLSLFAVFMFSLYFLNRGRIFNTQSKASYTKTYPQVTIAPSPSPTVKSVK